MGGWLFTNNVNYKGTESCSFQNMNIGLLLKTIHTIYCQYKTENSPY